MSNTNTSGPAFPVRPELCQDLSVEEQRGMTLRDYFAAKAMQGLLKNALTEEFHLIDNDWMSGISMDAYSMADAMLKARDA